MEPYTPNQNKHNAMIEAIGGLPALPPEMPKKSRKVPILIASVAALFVVLGVLAVVLGGNDNGQQAATPQTLTFSSEQSEGALETIQGFLDLAKNNQFELASISYGHPFSGIGMAYYYKELKSSYIPENIDWQSCATQQQDVYPRRQIYDIDKQTYDSVDVPVVCKNTSGGTQKYIYDVRISSVNGWLIYDIRLESEG